MEARGKGLGLGLGVELAVYIFLTERCSLVVNGGPGFEASQWLACWTTELLGMGSTLAFSYR